MQRRKDVRRARFADSDEEAPSGGEKSDEEEEEADVKEDIAKGLFGDEDSEDEEEEEDTRKVCED